MKLFPNAEQLPNSRTELKKKVTTFYPGISKVLPTTTYELEWEKRQEMRDQLCVAFYPTAPWVPQLTSSPLSNRTIHLTHTHLSLLFPVGTGSNVLLKILMLALNPGFQSITSTVLTYTWIASKATTALKTHLSWNFECRRAKARTW